MDTDREALLQEAVHMQKLVLGLLFQQRTTLPYWLELHISMAQLKGMFVLSHLKRSTIGEFAETLHIGRSSASLLVDHMVQDGLVERAEGTEDRRRTLICLSPRGEEMLDRLRQEHAEHNLLPAWLEKLSLSDLQALTQGLRALAAVAQAETGISDPWQTYRKPEAPST